MGKLRRILHKERMYYQQGDTQHKDQKRTRELERVSKHISLPRRTGENHQNQFICFDSPLIKLPPFNLVSHVDSLSQTPTPTPVRFSQNPHSAQSFLSPSIFQEIGICPTFMDREIEVRLFGDRTRRSWLFTHHMHKHKAAASLEVNVAKKSRRLRTEENELIFNDLGDFSVTKCQKSGCTRLIRKKIMKKQRNQA